jgi:uncharacterized repeat protein (TIGR04052 family)
MYSTKTVALATAVLVSLIVGCGETDDEPEMQDVEVGFAALVNGAEFACDADYQLGTQDTAAQISDFRFYVSNVRLIDADGNEAPVELENDGKWQNGSVALLDFEDGTGACQNGNADMNMSVKGMVEEGDYTGVRFTLGVPFDENHQNQAVADPPLNITSMFWSWQGGYKFVRVDGMAEQSAGFRIHLGSMACESPDGSNEVTGCDQPNRPTVTLDGMDPLTDDIALDVGTLYSDVDMTPNAEGKSAICMSNPDHEVCEKILPKLGLEFGDASAGEIEAFSVMSGN